MSESLDTLSQRAATQRASRNWPGLVETCSAIITQVPSNADAWYLRAYAYSMLVDISQSEVTEALRQGFADATKALRLDPNHPSAGEAYRTIGAYHLLKNKHLDWAVHAYSNALALKPLAQYYFERGKALQASGRHKEASADFARSLQLAPHDAALADFDHALQLDPEGVSTTLRDRASLYVSLEHWTAALADLRDFNRIEKQLGALEHRLVATCHFGLGHIDQSLRHANLSITTSQLMPNFAFALGVRGRALIRQGKKKAGLADLAESLRLFRAARSGAATIADAICNSAWGHRDLGKYKRALKYINEAMALVPPSAKFLDLRADCYCSMRQYNLAMANYTGALWLEPLKSHLWAARGGCQVLQGAYSAALGDLGEAIKLDAKSGTAYLVQAAVYITLSGWELALENLQKYLGLHSDDGTPDSELAEAYALIARCHKALGNDQEAAIARAAAKANGWEEDDEEDYYKEEEDDDE